MKLFGLLFFGLVSLIQQINMLACSVDHYDLWVNLSALKRIQHNPRTKFNTYEELLLMHHITYSIIFSYNLFRQLKQAPSHLQRQKAVWISSGHTCCSPLGKVTSESPCSLFSSRSHIWAVKGQRPHPSALSIASPARGADGGETLIFQLTGDVHKAKVSWRPFRVFVARQNWADDLILTEELSKQKLLHFTVKTLLCLDQYSRILFQTAY